MSSSPFDPAHQPNLGGGSTLVSIAFEVADNWGDQCGVEPIDRVPGQGRAGHLHHLHTLPRNSLTSIVTGANSIFAHSNHFTVIWSCIKCRTVYFKYSYYLEVFMWTLRLGNSTRRYWRSKPWVNFYSVQSRSYCQVFRSRNLELVKSTLS